MHENNHNLPQFKVKHVLRDILCLEMYLMKYQAAVYQSHMSVQQQ